MPRMWSRRSQSRRLSFERTPGLQSHRGVDPFLCIQGACVAWIPMHLNRKFRVSGAPIQCKVFQITTINDNKHCANGYLYDNRTKEVTILLDPGGDINCISEELVQDKETHPCEVLINCIQSTIVIKKKYL